jgi:hypothetical protein
LVSTILFCAAPGATAGLSISGCRDRLGVMKHGAENRTRIRHCHAPGHVHELTFSRNPPQQRAGLPIVHGLPAEWLNEPH